MRGIADGRIPDPGDVTFGRKPLTSEYHRRLPSRDSKARTCAPARKRSGARAPASDEPGYGAEPHLKMTAGTYRQTLKTPGLQPFLWTQFLGAFNDNLFKMVVSLVAVRAATAAEAGRNLSIISALFILPFILFSGYAGQLADVHSKRTVLVVTKSLEIVATTLGLVAFAMGHLQLTYAVLFLFAVQATFFSPAKYGILPEMLPDRDLSRANGVLEMSTFVAIVVGVAAGGAMFDAWQQELWLIGVIVIAIALAGTGLRDRKSVV